METCCPHRDSRRHCRLMPYLFNRRWRRYSQIFMEAHQELSHDIAGPAMSPFNSLKLHIFLICVHLRNLRSTSVAF